MTGCGPRRVGMSLTHSQRATRRSPSGPCRQRVRTGPGRQPDSGSPLGTSARRAGAGAPAVASPSTTVLPSGHRQGGSDAPPGSLARGIFRMDEATNADGRFHGYRFPAIIIGEVVWLRFRFTLSLRDMTDMMAARGIVLAISHAHGDAIGRAPQSPAAEQPGGKRPSSDPSSGTGDAAFQLTWAGGEVLLRPRPICGHFRPAQHRMDAAAHRATLTDRHRRWNDITATLLAERAAAA